MIDQNMITHEADAFFARNKDAMEKTECSFGMRFFSEFYDGCKEVLKFRNILEIGCSTGNNLLFMNRKYRLSCYGIDPSLEAVQYGNTRAKEQGLKIDLKQGFADDLPYDDNFFDVVYFGFCLYSITRESLFQTLSEGDRVLRRGGICVITDFDTPVLYSRENIHNKSMPNYKADYAKYVEPFGYTLIEKKMYAHGSDNFTLDIQERVSTQIFYKEQIQDIYVKG